MLDSVIYARDHFLKPGGLLFPDRAIIYCSPCELKSHFEDFERYKFVYLPQWIFIYLYRTIHICIFSVSGVSMRKFAESLRLQKSTKPEIIQLPSNSLLAEPAALAFIDLNDVMENDLDQVIVI